MYRTVGKRALDFVIAGIALVCLAPVIMAVALLVRWRLGRPVFFRQRRPGRHGQPFTLIKFRTMVELQTPNGPALDDKYRLTPFGAFLRRHSLDELPQLVNVVKGDMSLVGPRPLLLEYLERYTPEQARRHEVKPGITGWAQVNGRNELTWGEKFRLDVWYVDHCSLWLDLKILFLTLPKVFKRRGISARGHATMPVFQGPEE